MTETEPKAQARRSFAKYLTRIVPAGQALPIDVTGVNFFCRSANGSLDVSFGSNQEDRLPVFARMGYEFAPEDKFRTLTFHNDTGVDLTVSFIVGTVKVTGWDVDITMNNVIGSADDPRGVYLPPDSSAPSFYYKDQESPVIMWGWSVATQTWFPIMTA